jgi:DNA-binding MarR family transcriptional regulator
MASTSKHLYRILEFPKHLQVSILTLLKLGPSTASDVAALTGKARANESAYLNQLVTLKVVRKERREHRGRKVFFSVDLEALDW